MEVEIKFDHIIRTLISNEYGLKFIDSCYRYTKSEERDNNFKVPMYYVYYLAEVIDKERFMLFQLEYSDYIVKIHEK